MPPLAVSNCSRVLAGPASTSVNSSSDVDLMISLARATSSTPGNWTRIWSCPPWRATMGSATPSSFTRRSMVRMA